MAEADMDVEYAGGIAKDATVDYIYASHADVLNAFDALKYAITTYQVNNAVVPVISMSYGSCELYVKYFYPSEQTQLDSALAQAATQGQTILVSAGDGGGTACEQGDSISTNGLSADWPASSPYITGVGGTMFSGDGTGTGANQYWNWSYNNNVDIVSSALQYIPESSWNDTGLTGYIWSGGGGVSVLYPQPSWQMLNPNNFPSATGRLVPDVSFAASPNHDGYLVCTQLFPNGATSPAQTQGPLA